MKNDLTTKLLLAAIALGLFLNAAGHFVNAAHAQFINGHVDVTLVGLQPGRSFSSPLYVTCTNCN